MTLTQEAVKAIQTLKRGPFKLTAVKLELEAHLNRRYNGWDTSDCHNWLMERFADLGLAEYKEDDELWFDHDDDEFSTNWHPKGALKYAQFYNDGSVDSEITLTLSMSKPSNVLLLPKIIKIFDDFTKKVAETTGERSFRGAGMHIALINDRNCRYPSAMPMPELRRFENFRRSMGLLLPALYFLGANSDKTRQLEYRMPYVRAYDGSRSWGERRENKWGAVGYNQGAVEFRVFDACYDRPGIVLENIIVMKNCMKYWRSEHRPTGLESIGGVRFGRDSGDELSRFYVTHEHIDLLNLGLRKLKPKFLSIKATKQQRRFGITKTSINSMLRSYRKDLAEQYKEYDERFKLRLELDRSRIEADLIEGKIASGEYVNDDFNRPAFIESVKAEADTRVKALRRKKKSERAFIEQKLGERLDETGNWRLEAR